MPIFIAIRSLRVETRGWDAVDITEHVRGVIGGLGVAEGLVTVYTPERNVVVTLTEYEPGLLADIEEFIRRASGVEKIVLEGLFGKSVVLPIIDGDVETGVFKRIVLLDASREPGGKEVVVVVEGSGGGA